MVLYNSLQDFYNGPTANNPYLTNGDIYSNLTKKYYNALIISLNHMQCLIPRYKLFVFLLIFSAAQKVLAQINSRTSINTKALEECGLKEIFQSSFPIERDIDSIKITYFDNRIKFLTIFNGLSTTTAGRSKVMLTRFDLDYEGDLFALRGVYPKFYNGISSPKLRQTNWSCPEKNLDVIILPTRVLFSKATGSSGAIVKPLKIKELEAYLTKNYDSSIKPTKDSIIIIQTIVEKETGALGQKEILHGEKGTFYDFIF